MHWRAVIVIFGLALVSLIALAQLIDPIGTLRRVYRWDSEFGRPPWIASLESYDTPRHRLEQRAIALIFLLFGVGLQLHLYSLASPSLWIFLLRWTLWAGGVIAIANGLRTWLFESGYLEQRGLSVIRGLPNWLVVTLGVAWIALSLA